MPTFQYAKLVRDNIAKWHQESGHTPKTKVLNGKELTAALCEKLHEEADEVSAAVSRDELVEEIADVQQIIDDLMIHENISKEELSAKQKAKCEKKGGFSEGIYIESVYMPDEHDKWVEYCAETPKSTLNHKYKKTSTKRSFYMV